jgi:hypothetical protein
MHRMSVKMRLALLLVLGLIFAFGVLSCFAEETFTITTYYPSPCGVYNELQSNRLAVGDTNISGGLDAGDLPPANGQLYAARSVIYQPQSALPASNARRGELVYNDSDNEFYYYNGSAWMPQGGGGGIVITMISTYGASAAPACPTGFTSAYTGYWCCAFQGNGPGDCFCGPSSQYIFGTSGYVNDVQQVYRGGVQLASGGSTHIRCNICYK